VEMDYQYTKVQSIKLRDAGKDEKWLQERIQEDPSILKLGDLVVIERERQQISGGKIDFLMYDPEDQIRYEIEVMLGKLDESHIIRTIEYWDLEKTRYQAYEHRAVIVAEDITNRFFNVIRLLNRSIPIIAVQMNSFIIESKLVLDFVKVLDITEATEDEDQGVDEIVDRKYWEQKSNQKSLQLFDEFVKICKDINTDSKVTYNKTHIAVGSTGNNYVWFHPRKGTHIHFDMKMNPEIVQELHDQLSEAGIECRLKSNNKYISIVITIKELNENLEIMKNLIRKAEENSRE
jgi:hypothetical protein